ncbi:MAG: ABC transporter substrate-binding protein [Betaproteobacteria bacterium]|nr:ABC transporter substrate-binding protein [Betaproteobacteria bacterium]
MSHSPVRTTVAALAALGVLAVGPAAAQQTVKYGAAAISMSHAPAMVGVVAPELFAKHGVKLELTDFRGNSANCVTGVISNATDVCQVGTTSGTAAIVEGANLKGIAVIIGPISEIILSAKAAEKLGNVRPNSPVTERLRALKGLRVVSSQPGTPHYVTLDAMLKKAGMSMADLRYRTLGDTLAMMEGLRHDQIDAAMWTVGTLAGVLADKSGVRWINVAAGEVPEFRGVPYVTSFALASWVEKNPKLAEGVRAGLADATSALRREPAKYSKLLKAKYFPQMDPIIWEDSYQQALPSFFEGARAPKAGWDYLLQLQSESAKKDYSKAAWDKVLVPGAQAK